MAEKKIGSRSFRVEPLLATDALRLKARVIKIAGPAMTALFDVFRQEGNLKNASDADKQEVGSKALAALSKIFADNDPEEVVKLIKYLVETTQVRGANGNDYHQVDLDGDFDGDNQKDIMPLTLFVLREQFGDFFSGFPANGLQKGPETN